MPAELLEMKYRVCITCPLDDNEWPASMFSVDHPRCRACEQAQKRLNVELKLLDPTAEGRARIRKQRGICQECPNPVAGAVGKTILCSACGRRHSLERRRKADLRRRRDERGEKRRARRRQLHAERIANDPVYAAEYRRKRQRETLASNPSREKYLETQRRHNADPARAQKKRDLALWKYYEQHPERPQPVCATCSEAIEYTGKGKPPKYHQTRDCNPWLARLREGRAA